MTRPFISLFSLTDGQDVRKTAIAATRAGYAVVPVAPWGKAPVCTLTLLERRTAGPRHPCGVAHAITDDVTAGRVFKRLTLAERACNIGIVAGPSRLIIVDCDTREEVLAFLRDWAQATGDDGYLTHTPTVITPGQRDGNGGWDHKDGGHFYFAVPEGVTLDWSRRSTLKAPGGYLIIWGAAQVLAPPSVRAEGSYVATGDIVDAPDFLLKMVTDVVESVERRRTEAREFVRNDTIATWSVDTAWSQILDPHGWTFTGKLERSCGCEVWTKPGGGTTSPRSAIAHDVGCTEYPMVEGHGPLHLFTTDPGPELEAMTAALGTSTLTKLQVVAAYDYGGDVEAAMAGLGLVQDMTEWLAECVDDDHGDHDSDHGDHGSESGDTPGPADAIRSVLDRVPGGSELAARYGLDRQENDGVLQKVWTEAQKWRQRQIGAEIADLINATTGQSDGPLWGEHEDEEAWLAGEDDPVAFEAVVGMRSDGAGGIFYRGYLNLLGGHFNAGKTLLGCFMAVEEIRSGGCVVVLDFETGRKGWQVRMHDMGVDIRKATRRGQFKHFWMSGRADWLTQLTRTVAWMRSHNVTLVIVDSLARFTSSIGKDPDKTADALDVMGALRKLAVTEDTALVVIAHPKKPKAGNESWISAVEYMANNHQITDQADAAVVLVPVRKFSPGKSGSATVVVTKDRHGALQAIATERTRAVATFTLTPGPVEDVDNGLRADGMIGSLIPPPADGDEDDDVAEKHRELVAKVQQRIPEIIRAEREEYPDGLTKAMITLRLSAKQRAALEEALARCLNAGEIAQDDKRYQLP